MTSPSNAELREAIATQIYVMIGGHIITGKWDMLPKEFVPGVADDITKLFQAREQQLLTELLAKQENYGRADHLIWAVPVEVIAKYREGL